MIACNKVIVLTGIEKAEFGVQLGWILMVVVPKEYPVNYVFLSVKRNSKKHTLICLPVKSRGVCESAKRPFQQNITEATIDDKWWTAALQVELNFYFNGTKPIGRNKLDSLPAIPNHAGIIMISPK